MPSPLGKRPVRSAKQVQPAPGYVDSSTLRFDSEDEGIGSGGEPYCKDEDTSDDEARHIIKKLRLKGYFKAEAKVPPPPPDSSCLAYYPDTYSAIQKWNRIFGLPPPHPMNDASTTNLPELERDLDTLKGSGTIKSEHFSFGVYPGLRLAKFIKKNQFYDATKVGFEDFPGEIRSKC